jgi:hypothetical protein
LPTTINTKYAEPAAIMPIDRVASASVTLAVLVMGEIRAASTCNRLSVPKSRVVQKYINSETPGAEKLQTEQVSICSLVTPGATSCIHSNALTKHASPTHADCEPSAHSSFDVLDAVELQKTSETSCLSYLQAGCTKWSDMDSNSHLEKIFEYPKTLSGAVSSGIMITTPKHCIHFGVNAVTLNVNSKNACRVQFDQKSLLPILFCELDSDSTPAHLKPLGSLALSVQDESFGTKV